MPVCSHRITVLTTELWFLFNFKAQQLEIVTSSTGMQRCVYIRNVLAKGGRVAEWVRALDWRPGGPGFESCWWHFASTELWQFHLPRFASVFRMSGLQRWLGPATGQFPAGFEPHFGKTFRFRTLAIPFTPLCQCLLGKTQ